MRYTSIRTSYVCVRVVHIIPYPEAANVARGRGSTDIHIYVILHIITGTFPCLMVTFDMRRQFGFYLLQTYTPCTLLVILSWLSFWINKEAVPARITLGVTTVLAMATSLSNSSGAAMNVSYAKALGTQLQNNVLLW